MEQIEQNIIESFRLVKSDVIRMQNLIATLSQNQERIMAWINDTRDKETVLYQRVKDLNSVTKDAVKSAKKAISIKKHPASNISKNRKRFVASKLGKKVHEKNCPFAKNIKPKSRIIFKTKAKALNLGFKACDCIKHI